VNVGVNALVLRLLHGGHPGSAGVLLVTAAFLAAQVVSSTLNFVGMRQVVFVDRREGSVR
jgi:putative flippase GtrA